MSQQEPNNLFLDIIKVTRTASEEEANNLLQRGWLLLYAGFSEGFPVYILGKPKARRSPNEEFKDSPL
jgi:hypothetical protein